MRPLDRRWKADRLWRADYDSETDTAVWFESAIERTTPMFIWVDGIRLSRADLEQRGETFANPNSYCVESRVPVGEKRVTLAEQAERWERRKAEILAADVAFKAAAQRCEETNKQSKEAFIAYATAKTDTSKQTLRQATATHQQALDACEAAWDRRNRFTLFEIERAKREDGEAALIAIAGLKIENG
jgi:hypothetical protein